MGRKKKTANSRAKLRRLSCVGHQPVFLEETGKTTTYVCHRCGWRGVFTHGGTER